jgi:tetratricopeptide (TPR) repeat protein
MRLHLLALTALLGLGLGSAVHAAEPADNDARPGESADAAAYRINEAGKALVAVGKYEVALDKFKAALKLFPLSNAIFNVGSMYYTLKRYEEAYPYLQETLRAPLDPTQRQVVINYRTYVLQQLAQSHTELEIDSSPPGASLTVNGKDLPFKTPSKVLVPFGAADVLVSLEGFKQQMVVVRPSRSEPLKSLAVRLDRDEPDAQMNVRCPTGADVFIDGVSKGIDLVRDKLLLGKHVVRCGKTANSKAFEREITVRAGVGVNAFDFSNVKR